MNKNRAFETLKKLSLIFGPSGCEDAVGDAILELADGLYDESVRDSFGNVILKISSANKEKKPIMLSSHMDEVGFMISDIDEYGYLHFQNVGGIVSAVIPGRRVKVEAKTANTLAGEYPQRRYLFQAERKEKSLIRYHPSL
jgi:endoglucanase